MQTKFSHSTISPPHILQTAVEAMNDTVGENSLVPSRLVFWILPNILYLAQTFLTRMIAWKQ